MAQKPRSNRWNGWLKRKPSVLRPFPSLRMEELELRDVPATFTWSGGGGAGNTNWSNPQNWIGNVAPTGMASPGGGYDDLVFSSAGATRLANNNIVSGTFNSISFSSAGNTGYTITGNALTLGVAGFPGTGFVNVSQNSRGHDIQVDMKLNTGLAGFPASVQTFDVDGELKISGRLSGNSLTNFNSAGIGTLTLAGDNVGLQGPITITTNGQTGRLVVSHPNALGDLTNGTTVGTGTALVFANVGGAVAESISLNGSGNGDGTLYNQSGDNLLTGPIILDAADNTNGIIIKAEDATSLGINGVISDRSVGRILTKEGRGEVILNAANTYRGLTQVNSGILTVGNALALGADGDATSGTIVRSATAGQGQLRLASPSATGFTIFNEFLTLNGAGQSGLLNRGSLTNTNADNTWAGPVTLGSPTPNGVAVTIGTGAGTLTISGVISTPNGIGNNANLNPPFSNGSTSLTKIDTGTLIFNNANTYSCPTFIAEGVLIVRDSQSLGQASTILNAPIPRVTVENGATLQLEVEAGAGPNGAVLQPVNPLTGNPEDAHGRNLSDDSITHDAHRLELSNPLTLRGLGVIGADGFRVGALFSHSGINVWTEEIIANNAGIGVALDPRPGHPTPDSTYFTDDYSLTTTDAIIDLPNTRSTVTKLQPGHLIWPVANTYTGDTFVQRGWITAQHNRAFGARIPAVSPTLQPETFVTSGAAIHLRTLTPASDPLFIDENLILSGIGPKLPYKFISEKGALMNIGGDNVVGVDDPTLPAWTTYVALNGNVGIGVEDIAPAAISRLTIVGWMRNDTVTPAGVLVPNLVPTITDPNGQAPGGLTKYGSQRLLLEGDGTFSLATDIREGIVEARHNTALGQATSGTYNSTSGSIPQVYSQTVTTVRSAANLILSTSNAFTNGGISSGIQVAHEELILNSPGQQIAVAGSKVPAPSEFYLTFTNHLTDLLDPATRTTVGLESGLTAAAMQEELNKLPSVRGSEIQEITTGDTGEFTVTFNGQTTAVPLTGIPAGSTAAFVESVLYTLTSIRRNEIQDVIVLNGTAANTFTLTFNGQTTAPIPGNATALQVEAALNALPNVGVGGVTVVSAIVPGGFRYTVTFGGPALQFRNFPLMTAAGQLGLADPLMQAVQDGFHGTVRVTEQPATPAGTIYTVAFGGELAFQNLPEMTVAGTAAGSVRTMRDGVNGNIVVSESIGPGNGNLYTFTFGGDLANVDLPQMTVTAKDGTLPLMNTLQDGSAPATGEVQTASVVASQGTYTLTYKTETTPPIPITAPAVLVENFLNNLPTLVADLGGQVLVSKLGNVYTAVFNNAHAADTPRLVATPIFSPLGTPEVTISGNVDVDGYVSQASLVSETRDNTWRGPVSMDSGARVATTQNTRINFLGEVNDSGRNEIQDVFVIGGTLSNSFNLSFNGQTTISIPGNASPAEVQDALNALTNIGPNGVVVTGSAAPGGTRFTVTFSGALVQTTNLVLLTATGSDGLPAPLIRSVQDGHGNATGSDLVKRGEGELLLAGLNTYRGESWFDEGIATVGNSGALGTTQGGTTVANNAQLQVQGSLTVAGETLTIQGTGVQDASTLVDKWFNVGPASSNNVSTSGNQTVSARITSVTTDPQDPRVIYIATAGGGAWKTRDGGITWVPLFDDTVDAAAVMYGGQVVVAPSDPNTVYFATGEGNGGPNGSPIGGVRDGFAGVGVYVSTNAGVTWRLVTGPNSNNPIYGLTVTKLIVDPTNANRIYVATGTASVINAGVDQVANNAYGTAIPGVYRYDGSGYAGTPDWVNLTGRASPNRSSVPGGAPYDVSPPLNAGPDDDYRIKFPQENATWSDIALVAAGRHPNLIPQFLADPGNTVIENNNQTVWVLYAALGESEQRWFDGVDTQAVFNAVYRTEDPANAFAPGEGPTWWIGEGTLYPVSDPTSAKTAYANGIPAPTDPDRRIMGSYYVIGPESDPVDPDPVTERPVHAPGRNEWIKISAVVTRYFNSNQPNGGGAQFFINPAIQVYASNLGNSNTQADLPDKQRYFFPYLDANAPYGRTGEFLDIQRSNWDGGISGTWTEDISRGFAPFGLNPTAANPTPSNATGRYTSVLTNQSNTFGLLDTTLNIDDHLILAGKDDVYTATGLLGGAPTWTAFTQGAAAPADYFHALFIDRSTGDLLIGSDGGLWRDSFNPIGGAPGTFSHSFQNLNGNIAAAQINNIDPHPTDVNQALAALYNSGLQQFQGGLAWNAVTVPSVGGDRNRNAGDVRYDPKNPLNAYASVGGSFYRTQDGGLTWQRLLDDEAEPGWTISGRPNNLPVYVDPVNPSRVLVGGSNLIETLNAGASSVAFNNLGGGNTVAIAAATYQGEFRADPGFPLVTDKLSNTNDPDTIYITDGNHVRLTKNHGTTWLTRSPFANLYPYRIEFLGSLALSNRPRIGVIPIDLVGTGTPATLINGARAKNEIQSLLINATGGTYRLSMQTPAGSFSTGPIPFDARTEFIENQLNSLPGMVLAGGTGRVVVAPGVNPNIITDIAVDPSNRDTVYATVRQRDGQLGLPSVYRTTNAGITWDVISSNPNSPVPVAYASTDTPITITDEDPVGITSVIPVSVTPGNLVTNVTVTLNIQHDQVGDIRVNLVSPSGTRITLVNQRGGTGDNFTGTIFTDAASNSITDGFPFAVAPFTGPFQPEQPFSIFDGSNPNGNWTLEVIDSVVDNEGTLLDWTLNITSSPVVADALPFTQAWTVAVDPRSDTIYIGNDQGVWKLPNASSTNSYNWTRFGESLPDVQVHDLVLNQTLNTLTASTYGRGMYQLFLTDYQPAPGGIRVISGNSVWTGDVNLTGSLTITADGTQEIQNGIAAASLDILGVIRDTAPGNNSTITKSGLGTISFSGSNTYGGQTLVQQGVLRVKNPNALGVPDADSNTIVAEGAALELASDLRGEPVLAYGGGISVNGHFTGSVRSVANNNVYTGPLTLGSNGTIGVDSGNDLDPVINPGVRTNSSLRIGAHPQNGVAAPIVVATTVPGSASASEVQTVTIPVATNFFNLTFNNQTTGMLPRTATAAQIQEALDALPAFGPSRDEEQDVTVTGGAGTFTLTVTTPTGTQTTASIPYNATANVVQSALTALSNVGNGNVRVTLMSPGVYRVRFTNALGKLNLGQMVAAGAGGATANVATVTQGAGNIVASLGVSGSDTVVTLAFRGTYSNADQPLFLAGESSVAATSTLTPGSASATEVQLVTVFGATGVYNLSFNGATTGVLPANATPVQVQAALNALSTIGGVGGSVSVTSAPFGPGTRYTVTFGGTMANTDVPQMVAGDVGAISDSGSVFTLDKELAGTLILASANTIGGEISVNQGALRVEDAGALGSSGTFSGTQVLDGAQLQIARNAVTLLPTVIATESLSLSGTGIDVTGALRNVRSDSATTGTNDNMWAGPITFTINPGFFPQSNPGTRVAIRTDDSLIPGLIDTLHLNTNIQQDSTLGSFGLIKVGAGRLDLMQANSFTGTTEVGVNLGGRDFQGGFLRIANANSLGANAISNSVQTLSVVGLTGTYRLSFNGRTTAALNATATAAQVEAALNALTSIGQAEQQTITVTGAGSYQLVFDGQTTGPITTASGAAGIDAALSALSSVRRSELQDVLVSNSPGFFTLTFNGERTAPLPHDATTAQVQAALRALPSIAPIGVNVTVSPTSVPNARVYRVTFAGTLAFADQPQIIADTYVEDTVQDGGGGVNEIQTFTLFSTAGTFILSFNGLTTPPLPFTATAADVETALNALPSVGGVNGFVTVSEAAFGAGRQFTVTFSGTLADRDLPLIQAAGVGGPVTSVNNIQHGLNGSITVTGTAPNYTVTFGGDLAARDVPTMTVINGTASAVIGTGRPGGGVVVSETPSVGGKLLTVSFQRPLDLAIIPTIESVNVSSGLAVNVAVAQQGGIGAIVNSSVQSGSNVHAGPGSLEIDGDPLNLGTSINVIRDVVLNGTGPVSGVRVSSPAAGSYSITFDGALGLANIPSLVATGTGGATAAVVTTQTGSRDGNEIQTVTVTGTAGTFTLSLNGVVTAPIPFNATAAQVQAALNALTSIGGTAGALVNVSGNNTYSGNVTLGTTSHVGANPNTSLGVPVLRDPTPLTVPAPGLVKVGQGTVSFPNANAYGGQTIVRDGVLSIQSPQAIGTGRNETQIVTTNGTVGAFTLTFNGQTTVPLLFDAPASGGTIPTDSVQNALNALNSVRRSEIQTVTLGGSASGTFTLTFNGQTTSPLAFASSQSAIEAAFQALSSVGAGNATVSRTGNVITITFTGALANTDVGPISAGGFGGTTTTSAVVQDGLNGSATVTTQLVPGGRQYTIVFGGSLANMNLPEVIVTSGMVFVTTTTNGSATVSETQQVETFVSGLQTFTLSFNGQTTVPLAAGVQATSTPANEFPNGPANDSVRNALLAISSVRRNEVQTLLVQGTSGTFSLTVTTNLGGPQTLNGLAYNIPATGPGSLQNALEGLTNIGAGNVIVTSAPGAGFTTYTITFTGAVGNRNHPQMTTSGTGGAVPSMTTAIEGLNGDVTVTLDPPTVPPTVRNIYRVTFGGDLALRDVPQMTGASTTVSAFASPRTAFDGNGSETQYVNITATGGTFFLRFRGQQTSALLFTASAADVERALNALTSIGGIGGFVTVTKSGIHNAPGGATYTVNFGGSLANTNLPPLEFTTTGATVVIVTTGNDGPEGTVVQSGATLQLNGNMVMDREVITLNGQGFQNQGALNVRGGNVTWQALNPNVRIPLFLGSDASVGTTFPTDTITFLLPITDQPRTPQTVPAPASAGHDFDIYGPGTVVYASTQSGLLEGTTYTQYTGTTTVHEGTLLLSQPGGNSILGPLVIGDGVGGPNTAVVRETISNQIADSVTIRVNSDGFFDLNGLVDTVSDVTVVGGRIDTGTGGQLTTGFIDMTGGAINIGNNGRVTAQGDITMRGGASVVGAVSATLVGQQNLSMDASFISFGNFGTLTINDVNMTGGSKIDFANNGTFTARDVTADGGRITFGNNGVFSLANLDYSNGLVSFGTAGTLQTTGNVALDKTVLSFGNNGSATIAGTLTAVNDSEVNFGTVGMLLAGDTTFTDSDLTMGDTASATVGDLTVTNGTLSFGVGVVAGNSIVSAQDVNSTNGNFRFGDNGNFAAKSITAAGGEFDFKNSGILNVVNNVSLSDTDVRFDNGGQFNAADVTGVLGTLIEFLLNGILNVDDLVLASGSTLAMGGKALATMSTADLTDSTATFNDNATVTVQGGLRLAGSDLSVGLPAVNGESSLLQTGDVTLLATTDGSHITLGNEDTAIFGNINATGGNTTANHNTIVTGNTVNVSALNVTATDTDFRFGNAATFNLIAVNMTGTGGAGNAAPEIRFGTDGEFTTAGNLTLNNAEVTLGDRNLVDPVFDTQAIAMSNNAKITLGANTQGSSLGMTINGSTFIIGTNAVHTLGGNITSSSNIAVTSAILGPGTLDMGDTDRNVLVNDGPRPVDLTITAQIASSPTARLVKQGAGRLQFAPATGFTGPVSIENGDVQVDTTIGPVNLRNTTLASLSGNGTVGQVDGAPPASARASGMVNPGINYNANPAGILNTGNLLWGPNTTYFVNIAKFGTGAPVAGSDNDLIRSTGAVSLNGAQLRGSFDRTNIQVGDTFRILETTGSLTGSFAELFDPGEIFIDGHKFLIVYDRVSAVKTVSLTKVLANVTINATTGVTASLNPATQRQDVIITTTLTPEPGAGNIPSTNTVTYTLVNLDAPFQTYTGTVNVTGVNQAFFNTNVNIQTGSPLLPGNRLPGGRYQVTVQYNGDPVDFTTASGSLTGNPLVIEIPVFDTPVAQTPFISPTNSPGVKDSTLLSANVIRERGRLQAWSFDIYNSANTLVRSLAYSGPLFDPTPSDTTVPISMTWNGRDSLNAVVPSGDYTVIATFTDEFGNTGASAPITVVVDELSPTVTTPGAPQLISPNLSGLVTPTSATITSTVGDQPFSAHPAGTFESWTIEIRNSSNVIVRTFTGTNTGVSQSWNGTLANNTTLVPDGVYTVTIRSLDQAGNTTTSSGTPIVVLNSPPTSVGSSIPTSTVYGQTITLRADVTVLMNDAGVPAGVRNLLLGDTVEFYRDSSTFLTSGQIQFDGTNYFATVTVPTFNAGTYSSMFVRYAGSSDFIAGNSQTFTHIVTPAPLTVTAIDVFKQYGDPVPVLNLANGYLTVSGLVNNDLAPNVVSGTALTTATQSSPVIPSGYPITQGTPPTGVTVNSNYELTFVPGTLFVTKAPLTINIQDKQRSFRQANPPFTFTATGLLLGDQASVVTGFTLETTATVTSPPGMYPIYSVGTPTAQNYTITNFNAGTGRITPEGVLEIIPIPTPLLVGPGSGHAPLVKVYSPTGQPQSQFFAFSQTFTGGVRTATGDFNRDGVMDYVVGTGPGTVAQVRVINGATGVGMFNVNPFEDFTGGVFVTAGDIDGDGADELIITPDEGGGPRIAGYRGMTFEPFISYFGIDDKDFRGGARAAVGDLNDDGFADIAISAGFQGGPRISIWDGKSLASLQFKNMVSDFFAYEPTLRNGAYVAIGDVDGDGKAELITGAGPGGGPRVKIWNGADLLTVGPAATRIMADFFAGDPDNRGGVRVAVKSLDNDLFADLATGVGDGGGNTATTYLGLDLKNASQDPDFDPFFDVQAFPGFMNGVFVG